MVELTLLENNFGKKKDQYISHRFRDDELTTSLKTYYYDYFEENIMENLIR